MTEEEWLDCDDPWRMLEYVHGTSSERKSDLFTLACLRRVKHLLTDEHSLRVIEMFDRYTEGITDWDEVKTAEADIDADPFDPFQRLETDQERIAFRAGKLTELNHDGAAKVVWYSILASGRPMSEADNARGEEFAHQADLLRHIVDNPFKLRQPFKDDEPTLFDALLDNPFRPYPARGEWPRDVAMLAAALYDGEDCAYALRDALLENGIADLAAHFAEAFHPKGCWAMDLILGKE